MIKLQTIFWRWWYTKVHPSTPKFTRAEALDMAKEHGLESEVATAMEHGYTPDEALQEWDIYPYQ